MRIDWKRFIVVLVVVLTVVAMTSLTTALAARGGVQGGGGPGGSQGMAGGERPAGGAGVKIGGGQGVAGGAQRIGGGGMGSQGGVKPGVGQGGQFTGGIGQGGVKPGVGQGGISAGTGRSFNRNEFFGGRDHNWWRMNQQHHYWNGNAWVFGVEPVGFVPVPVPVSSCPYSPDMYGGDPNACFFSCTDNGYDPVSVCNVCCGTNY